VDVIAIDENVITVSGLDAFNGTPVLDLKPA
jgi:tRNA (Thr-GGU) A37 N-methylase